MVFASSPTFPCLRLSAAPPTLAAAASRRPMRLALGGLCFAARAYLATDGGADGA